MTRIVLREAAARIYGAGDGQLCRSRTISGAQERMALLLIRKLDRISESSCRVYANTLTHNKAQLGKLVVDGCPPPAETLVDAMGEKSAPRKGLDLSGIIRMSRQVSTGRLSCALVGRQTFIGLVAGRETRNDGLRRNHEARRCCPEINALSKYHD